MLRVFACGLLMAWLESCAGHACPRMPHTDSEKALSYHDSMRVHVHSFRARARVDQFNHKGRLRGTVMMFVERPDRLRFDAMTQFGPAAVLTSNGTEFGLVDLREKVYWHGMVCPENMARLMGVTISAEELSLLLLGQVPRIHANAASMQCSAEGFYRIKRFGLNGHRQEIDLDIREADLDKPLKEQRLRVIRVELYDPSGKTEWRVTYDDYKVIKGPKETQGVAMPFKVRLEDPKRGGDTLVRFEDVDINVQIPEDVFSQTPPPGMRIRQALCQ